MKLHINTNQLFIIMGILLLLTGIFLPLLSVPKLGQYSYYTIHSYHWIVIAGLIATMLVLLFFKLYQWVSIPALFSLGMIIYTLANLTQKIHELRNKLLASLDAEPWQKLYVKLMMDSLERSTNLRWGFAIIVAGIVFIIIGAFIDTSPLSFPKQGITKLKAFIWQKLFAKSNVQE